RSVAKHDVVDEAWVEARYGVRPRSYVDFAVLRGDASDGLPGVRGIGDKTAAALLDAHGDLDRIVIAVGDDSSALKPRVRSSLRDSLAYIAAAREVVAVRRDLGLPRPQPSSGPQAGRLRDFGERWGVSSPVERLLGALSR